MLEVLVLGPVGVADGTEALAIGSGRQRALLAALALSGGQVVSVDALIEALWGDEPPGTARGTLQAYVSRLRSVLGTDAIVHEPGGYRLDAATDLAAAERLAAEARDLLPHHPARAADLAAGALDRWRGPALGELAGESWFVPDAVRIAELRRTLVDDRTEALVRAGRAADALPDAERAAATEPLRERSHLLLTEALAAVGRTAEALRAADAFRRHLAEETGLEPTEALAGLEQRILLGGDRPPEPAARRAPGLSRPGALVGRDDELAALGALLDGSRLVTVVGTGGVGKTRLVAELLHDRRSNAVVVELAGVDRGKVPAAVAEALGLRLAGDAAGTIGEHLAASPTLLVLDNCEHVVAEVAALVRSVLDAAAGVRVLATSRQRLGLPEEHVFALAPLATDGPDAPGVVLLLDRLRRATAGRGVDPDVAAAEALARALDGVPLALELAAGRAAALGVDELLRRLDGVLDLVGTTAGPPRQATLRAVVDWSYALLDDGDRAVLDCLGVFDGGAPLDAVEAVAGPFAAGPVAASVGRLVDASLVAALPGGGVRVLDTVRRYAAERLAARPWAADARAAHDRWVAGLLDDIAGRIPGPHESTAMPDLRRQLPDVRAALDRIVDGDDADLAAGVARALSVICVYRPDGELLAWMRRAAERPAIAGPDVGAAAARAAYLLGDVDAARTAAGGLDVAVAHHALGVAALYRGEHAEAAARFGAAADDGTAPVAVRLDALGGLALAHCYAGDPSEAAPALQRQRVIAESTGSETYRAFADYVAGELALADADPAAAIDCLRTAVARARAVHADFVVGIASTALLSAAVRTGDTPAALHAAGTLVDHWWRSATWPQLWTTLRLAADALVAAGRADTAALVLAAADHDPAAPAVVGDDAARLAAVEARAVDELGGDVHRAVVDAATALPRGVVVQRARQVLAEAAR